ncbi:MAG: hypothetical protein LH470_01490 [Lysobacter sp.]|nr:hypothetical protein [Lysobacter sp.]
MKNTRLQYILIAALIGGVALVGCKKKEDTAIVPPVATEPMPAPAPMPMPAPASDFAVNSIDLGNTVGADMKVVMPATTFAPKDTIHASVSTTGMAANANVTGKWLFQDGQTVHEDPKTVTTTGPAMHDFSISKPDGFPAGNYKFELWVNGALAQTREFMVK